MSPLSGGADVLGAAEVILILSGGEVLGGDKIPAEIRRRMYQYIVHTKPFQKSFAGFVRFYRTSKRDFNSPTVQKQQLIPERAENYKRIVRRGLLAGFSRLWRYTFLFRRIAGNFGKNGKLWRNKK
jgi:hypothetical protein